MDNKQIINDMAFVEKYKEYEVLFNEPETSVIRLYAIYNTFDAIRYMYENPKANCNIDDLLMIYITVYDNMKREITLRYHARRILLINNKACENYSDNITFLKNLWDKHKKTIEEESKKVEVVPINKDSYSITKISPTIFINLIIVIILILINYIRSPQ